MYTITPQPGYYRVSDHEQSYSVTKDKQCTCGGTATKPCAHIQAVAAYLREGGTRAPEATTTCPVCGALVTSTPYGWRCPTSPGHYWRWRGERSGMKAFLTQPHPNKQGAFYEQTDAERDAFLAQAHRRMTQGGYSPYGGG